METENAVANDFPDTGSDLPEDESRREFRALLKVGKFDEAMRIMIKIRDDKRLKRSYIKDYIARLAVYLRRLKPEREVTEGWLQGEASDFASTIEYGIAILGEDFYHCLIEDCLKSTAGTKGPNRQLVNFFMELNQEGFNWKDIVSFCLHLAAEDLAEQDAVNWNSIYEKLSNVRQFVAETPSKCVDNPIQKTVRRRSKVLNIPRDDTKNSFFAGKTEITLDDISRQVAIAQVCSTLQKFGLIGEFRKPGPDGQVNLEALLQLLLRNNFFRDAVLLARYTRVSSSSEVFATFVRWVLDVSVLADDQWESFERETMGFLKQLNLLKDEIQYNAEYESADMFVERVLSIIHQSFVNVFLEFGTQDDLRAILSALVSGGAAIFSPLASLLISSRFFRETVWILLSMDGSHEHLLWLFSEWLQLASGEGSATSQLGPFSPLSMSEDLEKDVPYVDQRTMEALNYYFQNCNESVQSKWTELLSSFNQLKDQNPALFTENAVALPVRSYVPDNIPSGPDD